MALAKWSAPGSRSSNFAGSPSVFNGLTNGSESVVVTYDNSTNRNLYGAVTLKLGSITPSSGGSVTLRVTMNDGTDTSDRAGGDLYSSVLLSGASAKVVIFSMVRIYPFSLRFSLINNSGVTLAGSGNEIYVTPYNEDVS
jgi:hypothetical protein